MHFLQRFVGEETGAGVGDGAKDGWGEAFVHRPQALLAVDLQNHLKDVVVPEASTTYW